jgi:hypothetical protein
MKKIIQDIQIKKPLRENIPIKIVDNTFNDSNTEDSPIVIKRRIHIPRTPQTRIRKSGAYMNNYIFIAFILSLLIGISFFSYKFFQKVTIDVQNKVQNIDFNNESFVGYKSSDKSPHFEIMILNDTMNQKVSFSSIKNVSIKAKGSVVFKNEYSTKPQKLAIHTKITEDTGKMYLIDTAVTIPGYTKDKSGKIIPGTAKSTVTAYDAGAAYNTDARAFLIPGLQKTDKYAKIYAVSDIPISGGADGNMYGLDSVSLGTLEAAANTVFREQANRKLAAQIPDGYILYNNATNFSYSYDVNTQSKDKDGVVVLKGTISAVILKKDDLEQAIIRRVSPSLESREYSEIKIPDLSVFSFNFSDKNQQITKDMTSLSFTLTGKTTMVWHPDLNLLKNTVKGINIKDLDSTAKNDPGVAQISAKFRFPWQEYLPTDLNKIEVLNR